MGEKGAVQEIQAPGEGILQGAAHETAAVGLQVSVGPGDGAAAADDAKSEGAGGQDQFLRGIGTKGAHHLPAGGRLPLAGVGLGIGDNVVEPLHGIHEKNSL